MNHETQEFIADNLFAGTQVAPVVADEVRLQKGQGVLLRGSLLQKDDDVYVLAAAAAEGEAADVVAVLAEDTNTDRTDLSGDYAPAPGYLTGEYNIRALIVADGTEVKDYIDGARRNSIFIKDTVPA